MLHWNIPQTSPPAPPPTPPPPHWMLHCTVAVTHSDTCDCIHDLLQYSLLLPVPLQPSPGSSVDTSRAARRHRNTSQQGDLLLCWKGRREALAAPTLALHCSALIGIFRSGYIHEWVCMCVGAWVCGCGRVGVGECRMVSSFMFQSVWEHWHKVQITCQQSPHTTWLVLEPNTGRSVQLSIIAIERCLSNCNHKTCHASKQGRCAGSS